MATYYNHNNNLKTITVKGEDFVASGTRWQVSVEGMAAADFDRVVTCVIYDETGAEVGRCADTIEGYPVRAFAAGQVTTSLGMVCQTMAKYCQAAYAYFHYGK